MAGRIALDLKQFKHVKSDDKSTTLQHKDGHELKMAHKGLAKEHVDQLKALSKVAKDSSMPTDRDEMKQDQDMMADGGKVEKKKSVSAFIAPNAAKGVDLANKIRQNGGAPHGSTISIPTAQEQQPEGYGKVIGPNGEKPKVFAEGGEVDDSKDQQIQQALQDPSASILPPNYDPSVLPDAPKQPDEIGMTGGGAAAISLPDIGSKINNNMAASFGLTPAAQAAAQITTPEKQDAIKDADTDAIQKASEANDAVAKAQQTAQNPMQNAMAQQGDMLSQGYQNEMKGIQSERDAQMALGTKSASLLADQVSAQQTAQNAYKASYDKLEQERQAHMEDIKNDHIDPNKYWTGDKNGNGSHSKIMAGIGMILAGFDPVNRPNSAIEFLNKQMDMNLEAQKQNLNSDNNLLQANLHQFGNLKDATDMTRLMQADIVHNQLLGAAATASSPMAAAAAQKAAGQLQMQYAPLQQQMAMRQAMMGLAKSGDPSNTAAQEQMIQYARMTNPDMAKEMESRLVPQVGMAKIPVPDNARQQIISGQKLQTAAQDLMQYSKTHTNIVPGTAEYTFGTSKAMAFQQMVREGLLGTVFRESEKPLLEKFVKENPAGAMKALTTQPQLKAIMESNANSLNSIKSAYGLPTSQTPMSAEPVKGKDGKMYVQQGQYMVPYNPRR